MSDEKLTNSQIIERVKAWQSAGFVHPLTCIGSSKHPLLEPVEKDGKVILRCPKCKREQLNIPPSILTITPEMMAEEKQKLIENGFKF